MYKYVLTAKMDCWACVTCSILLTKGTDQTLKLITAKVKLELYFNMNFIAIGQYMFTL